MGDTIRVVVEVPKTVAKTEKEAVYFIRSRMEACDEHERPRGIHADRQFNWRDRVKEYTRVITARDEGPEAAIMLNKMAQDLHEIARKLRGTK